MIKLAFTGPDDCYIYNRNGFLPITGEKTRSAERVWHSCYQNVPFVEESASKLQCLFGSQKTIGPVAIFAVPNVSKLNEPDISSWVLIFAFNPISINKYPVSPYKIFNGG